MYNNDVSSDCYASYTIMDINEQEEMYEKSNEVR